MAKIGRECSLVVLQWHDIKFGQPWQLARVGSDAKSETKNSTVVYIFLVSTLQEKRLQHLGKVSEVTSFRNQPKTKISPQRCKILEYRQVRELKNRTQV